MDAFDVFDPSRGEFKVKMRGLYVFSFDAWINSGSKDGSLGMYINYSFKHWFVGGTTLKSVFCSCIMQYGILNLPFLLFAFCSLVCVLCSVFCVLCLELLPASFQT